MCSTLRVRVRMCSRVLYVHVCVEDGIQHEVSFLLSCSTLGFETVRGGLNKNGCHRFIYLNA